MRVEHWSQYLKLLDSGHTEIIDPQIVDLFADSWEFLQNRQFVVSAKKLTEVTCLSCGNGPFRVVNQSNRGFAEVGQYYCPECGLVPLKPEQSKSWQLQPLVLIEHLRRASNIVGESQLKIPNCLWLLGRRLNTLARHGPQYLMFGGDSSAQIQIGEILKKEKNAVLWVLTEESPALTGETQPSQVFTIVEFFHWVDGELRFNQSQFKESYRPTDGIKIPVEKTAPLRRDRDRFLKHIRGLVREARDRYYATINRTRGPELPTRPAQNMLAEYLGISESRISRLVNNMEDTELLLPWYQLVNLDLLLSDEPMRLLIKWLQEQEERAAAKRAEISEEAET